MHAVRVLYTLMTCDCDSIQVKEKEKEKEDKVMCAYCMCTVHILDV